ncbi:MAG: FAD/NAD(P)-binding protein [Peptococcaceae bacterium]|nr:FAD/NAD(P)-binding protein [Peptococcaceae bacterium]
MYVHKIPNSHGTYETQGVLTTPDTNTIHGGTTGYAPTSAGPVGPNPLLPQRGIITKIITETPDTKTFCITGIDGTKPFSPQPGQLGMLSLPAYGEAMFSVTSQDDTHLHMAIKAVGELTNALHEIEEGQECGIRGPYGNGFPLEFCRGKDLIFIAGGIGLAPVRSLIEYCINHRADFGKLTIVYGARSYADLVFKEDLFENWPKVANKDLYITIDRAEETWDGHVGFVPSYIEELALSPSVAVVCGPPIMIQFTLANLEKMGFCPADVITTMEMRMKCGIGKCGRCNIGSCFVCLDGPVFTQEQLNAMPAEY